MQNRKNEIVGLVTEVLYTCVYCGLLFGLVLIVVR